MVDPSEQLGQTPGELISPTPQVPPSIDTSSISMTDSLMTSEPDIPEKLMVELPETQKNLLSNDIVITKTGNLQHILIWVIILGILVLGMSSIAYAYIKKIGPFGSSTYTEANFSSSILEKISALKSASYAFSASLNVVPRDADAMPFIFTAGDDDGLKQKYASDVARWENILQIRMVLNKVTSGYPLPNTLKDGFSCDDERFYCDKPRDISIVDPLTQKEYEYKLQEDQKDYSLSITFETDEIVKAIKESQKSGFSQNPDSTIIDGKKVTFTKGSLGILMDTELPKPFLTQMSEYMSMLPVDTKGKITVATSSELKPGALADWTINIDAEGGMSDMTYKLNIDALKKNDNYFVKINNFPALFFLDQFGTVKNKWIIIPAGTAKKAEGSSVNSTETSTDIIHNEGADNMAEDVVQNFEKTYKENRELIFEMIKKVAAAADKEEIIIFKNKPKKETIDGKELYRYEVSLRKEKISGFLKKLGELSREDDKFVKALESGFGISKGEQKTETPEEKATQKKELEDHLKSEEFNQIFDYLEKNNNLIIWTDSEGVPVRMQNTSRIVPPDTAEVLKDKQVSLIYEFTISNIDSPIVVNAPTDAVTWESISKELNPYQDRIEETKIIAGLSTINTIAIDLYTKEQSYGKKGFGLGPCTPKEDTLFANKDVVDVLNGLTNNTMSLATCSARSRAGKVFSWAISIPLPNEPGMSYCFDTTTSKKITGNLKGFICK